MMMQKKLIALRTPGSRPLLALMTVIVIMLMLLLAACGSASSSNNSGSIDYSGTIVIWHGWQGAYLQAKQAIFNEYMHLHPKVKIVLVHQDNIASKAATAVKAGNGPDIIAFTDDNLGSLALGHIVVPLDQYISQDDLNQTYSPAAASALVFNGHVYGVPEAVEAITLMYNKSLVSADQLPKTTDDLLAFAKRYQQTHPGQYGVVWPTEDAYFNAPWFYGFGAQYVTPDGKAHLDTPQALQAMEYIASFRPYLPKQPTYDVVSSLFAEGKAAIIINGPWSYADYASGGKINIGFATLPIVNATGTPAKPFVGVKSLWMAKTAKNPALVADLMKFYTNKANQIAMSRADGEIPANSSAADDPAIQALPAVAGYAAQVKLGLALPNTPYMSALWTPVQNALTAVWNGTQTPAKALSDAQAAATKGIAQISS
ncbi:sugar ABC transporter substrate-binding protein [Thermogemmatispora sp.]|uniref:sugar ABC transporter substrate-binding protein n=1 Tax=Thermogemmatispora sp. TaxID=1968838 RepID=UPI001E102C45|nr:extracellular solute-binding protein [Thermogemmatispora sp.]MBX5449932.1 extracellular solute-binding protein [Thermogemmatispora sp.]